MSDSRQAGEHRLIVAVREHQLPDDLAVDRGDDSRLVGIDQRCAGDDVDPLLRLEVEVKVQGATVAGLEPNGSLGRRRARELDRRHVVAGSERCEEETAVHVGDLDLFATIADQPYGDSSERGSGGIDDTPVDHPGLSRVGAAFLRQRDGECDHERACRRADARVAIQLRSQRHHASSDRASGSMDAAR